jgi:hypothetical protein
MTLLFFAFEKNVFFYQFGIDSSPRICGLRRLGRRSNREAIQMNDANKVKKQLQKILDEMEKNSFLHVKNPTVNFSRKRKLGFSKMMKIILSMGAGSIKDELLEHFDYSNDTVTASAFVQARDKINWTAFEFLLKEFNSKFHSASRYKGYHLKAIDGSTLNIFPDKNDKSTFRQNSPNSKPYALLHLNASYDLLNKSFCDAIVQPGNEQNEKKAFRDLVDRDNSDANTIFIADRGYEGYNNFAHVMENHKKFLIRAKDKGSNGILSGISLPETEEFDIDIELTLTRRHTNEVKKNPKYKFMPAIQQFDFLDENMEYTIKFRAVRFQLTEDSYEVLMTNLSKDEFDIGQLKELYHLRWGIETSFRHLKYVVGLENLHSKKVEFIIQEVFSRMILHNFCERITEKVILIQKKTKHLYQLNFTRAFRICRAFLRRSKMIKPLNIVGLIQKELLPVRPNRTSPRSAKKNNRSTGFLYRVL